MTLYGIDVSHYQPTTPPLTGLSFLFAKASQGTTKDALYDMHIANGRKAGLVVGAYCFNVGSMDIAKQVAAFVAAAGNVDLYAIDVEGADAFTPAQTKQFMDTFRALTGRKIGLYHSASGFFQAGQDFDWVAKWSTTPPLVYDFWQYQGSPLDKDQYAGTLEELKALAGGDMGTTFNLIPGARAGTLTVRTDAPHFYRRLLDGTMHGPINPATFGTKQAYGPVTAVPPFTGGQPGEDRSTVYIIGDEAAELLVKDVTFTPDATCDPAELDAEHLAGQQAGYDLAVNGAVVDVVQPQVHYPPRPV
jgi:hypothetical protein